jgi:hypothetical protein
MISDQWSVISGQWAEGGRQCSGHCVHQSDFSFLAAQPLCLLVTDH